MNQNGRGQNGVGFTLFLGQSGNGLYNWQKVVKLSDHSSQPQVWLNPDGDDILVAFETYQNNGKN